MAKRKPAAAPTPPPCATIIAFPKVHSNFDPEPQRTPDWEAGFAYAHAMLVFRQYYRRGGAR